jgi:hypothetical protein
MRHENRTTFCQTEQQPACQTLWQAVRNPLKSLERVKGTGSLKANSLKIWKIIFGQSCVLYSYFVAPTLALGQPIWSPGTRDGSAGLRQGSLREAGGRKEQQTSGPLSTQASRNQASKRLAR